MVGALGTQVDTAVAADDEVRGLREPPGARRRTDGSTSSSPRARIWPPSSSVSYASNARTNPVDEEPAPPTPGREALLDNLSRCLRRDTRCGRRCSTGSSSSAGRAALDLYAHQEEAILELFGGANVILATPTGSGKSLVALASHFMALGTGSALLVHRPDQGARVGEVLRPVPRPRDRTTSA